MDSALKRRGRRGAEIRRERRPAFWDSAALCASALSALKSKGGKMTEKRMDSAEMVRVGEVLRSQAQDIRHGVQPGFLLDDVLGRGKGSVGVAVARVAADR